MYSKKVLERIKKNKTRLVIGLDPRPELIEGDILKFLKHIVETTAEHAAAYKPNTAYFEALGCKGYDILYKLLQYIPEDIPVILDAKKNDIPETQRYYAKAVFEEMKADAVTVNPYLGMDSLEPFMYKNKCIYILGITSNKGAADIQFLKIKNEYISEKSFEIVKRLNKKYSQTDSGLVIGLTNLDKKVITRIPDVPLLIPGLGAQGGNIKIVKEYFDEFKSPVLFNVSRSVLYGSKSDTFDDRAKFYKDRINEVFK